ncbi:hypothetical protein HD554DRAFT_2175669 [Boletus coccyginus]|nr:hypothetical protein HD554DRAFT_2175669 [Boletus coccyginus]
MSTSANIVPGLNEAWPITSWSYAASDIINEQALEIAENTLLWPVTLCPYAASEIVDEQTFEESELFAY